MRTRILLLKFSLSGGDIIYKFHAFIPTQDGYKEYIKSMVKVPRKRLSPKVMTKTFISFSTNIIDEESLANRINCLCRLPGLVVIIKR